MKIQIIVAAHKPTGCPPNPHVSSPARGESRKGSGAGLSGGQHRREHLRKERHLLRAHRALLGVEEPECDYIGLAHYRRHFRGKSGKDKWDCILTTAQAEQLLQNYDVLVPKRRNYYIETAYNQYVHAHLPSRWI